MAQTVKYLESYPNERWDKYVFGHKNSSFFHLSSWAEVITQAFGHKPYYLYVENAEKITGILPVVHTKSFLFGNALISLPFCVYGGILADNDAAKDLLENAACELAINLNVDYLEMRNQENAQENWPVKELYVTFKKLVSSDIDKNMLEIPRKQRAVIRKGAKNNLHTEFVDDIDLFYSIYSESVRNHGTPVLKKKYFVLLKEYFKDNCKVLFTYKDDLALSCVMSFYFRDEVLPYYGGGILAARKWNSFDYMYWQLMCDSVEDGPKVFDYGRSKVGSGSYRFKKHWGFESQPLPYQYFLHRARELPNLSPTNPKYDLLIKIWKKLPLSIANMIGPVVSKNLG